MIRKTCPTSRRRPRRSAILGLLTGLLLTGCTGSPTAAILHRAVAGRFGVPDTAGTHAQGVRYTAATVDLPRSTVAAELIAVSADGTDYTFARRDGAIARLRPGRVLLAEGTAIRRVDAVTAVGSGVRVRTSPAALTDAVRDGRLRWTVPVDVARGRPMGSTAGTSGGYRYSVGFAPHGTTLTVTARLSRRSPVAVALTAVSNVSRLTSTVDLTVRGDRLVSATVSFSAASVRTDVSYSATSVRALSTGGEQSLRLPTVFRVPVVAGGVPFSIGVGGGFSVAAGFGRTGLAVAGRSSFRFAGTAGVVAGGADPTPVRRSTGSARTVSGPMPAGPVGTVLGATLPRLDLGIGWYGATPAAAVDVSGSTARQVDEPAACDAREATLQVSAGLEDGGLARTTPSSSAPVRTERASAARPPGCGTIAGS